LIYFRNGLQKTLTGMCANSLPCILFGLSVTAAVTPAPSQALAEYCKVITGDAERLACYDHTAGHSSDAQNIADPSYNNATESRNGNVTAIPPSGIGESYLWQDWELERGIKGHTFRLLPYRTTYFLPVRYSDNTNISPKSPSPNHTASTYLPIESVEAKFQLSLKIKVWENIIGENGNLWLAYTQQSYWQMYNGSLSSPFRETDYEPEAMIAFRTNIDVLGMRWRILNLGFVHQSNGREDPYSRSWNRFYGQFGLERDKFTLLVRPWLRLPENTAKDDNPDIGNYFGNGDIRIVYRGGGHIYSVIGRYSVPGRHGALQFDGEFPISGPLKGYLQLFSGYGESLIDYNHYQNVIGIGLLLAPWQ
jgi:phospholipase A1